jgi:hypothetical protein
VSRGVLQAWAFFYAGGKALDSLYDAKVNIENEQLGFDMDTLHSIDNSGRSAVLLHDAIDYWASGEDCDFLLYKGADKIPHKTNPQMVGAVRSQPASEVSLSVYPSIAAWGIHVEASLPAGNASLKIFNELGVLMQSRSIYGDDNVKEFFNTDNLPNGNYFLVLESRTWTTMRRFIVQKEAGQLSGFQAMQQRSELRNWPIIKLGPEETR